MIGMNVGTIAAAVLFHRTNVEFFGDGFRSEIIGFGGGLEIRRRLQCRKCIDRYSLLALLWARGDRLTRIRHSRSEEEHLVIVRWCCETVLTRKYSNSCVDVISSPLISLTKLTLSARKSSGTNACSCALKSFSMSSRRNDRMAIRVTSLCRTFESPVEVAPVGHFETRVWHKEAVHFAEALPQTRTNQFKVAMLIGSNLITRDSSHER